MSEDKTPVWERPGAVRVGKYCIRPDSECWVLSTIQVSEKSGKTYEVDKKYPADLPRALKSLHERMVREGSAARTIIEVVNEAQIACGQIQSSLQRQQS